MRHAPDLRHAPNVRHAPTGPKKAQRGPKAAARANVFYHLTYEGAVDLERIEDDDTKDRLRSEPKPGDITITGA